MIEDSETWKQGTASKPVWQEHWRKGLHEKWYPQEQKVILCYFVKFTEKHSENTRNWETIFHLDKSKIHFIRLSYISRSPSPFLSPLQQLIFMDVPDVSLGSSEATLAPPTIDIPFTPTISHIYSWFTFYLYFLQLSGPLPLTTTTIWFIADCQNLPRTQTWILNLKFRNNQWTETIW